MSTSFSKRHFWGSAVILIGFVSWINSLTGFISFPGSLVSIHAAWMMMLSGTVVCLPEHPVANKVRNAIATLIIGISMITLIFLILNKNLSQTGVFSMTTSVLSVNSQSSRSAPNTCIAFIFIGFNFLILGHAKRAWSSIAIRMAQTVTICMVIIGIVAYYVDFNELYVWYDYNRMSVPTAVTLIILCSEIWKRYKTLRTPIVRAAVDEGARIVLLGALLLSGMGFAAGMAGFAVFMNHQEKTTGNQLVSSAVSLTRLYDTLIDDGLDQVAYVARSTRLAKVMEEFKKAPDERKRIVKHSIDTMLSEFNTAGFSRLAVYSENRDLVSSVGESAVGITNSLAIEHDENSKLLFGSNFYLQSTRRLMDIDGNIVGFLVSERALTKLRDSYFNVNKLGKTADSIICGQRLDAKIQCFPSVLTRNSLLLDKVENRTPLPIDAAIDGRTGAQKAIDYRGKHVIAAYAPIGNTGLGAILKMDRTEMYLPIRTLLEQVLITLFFLLLIGILILKKIMEPVVSRIVVSQELAEERAIHTQAIVDHVYDGIVSMDASGRIATFNKACEIITGYQSKEVIGMHFTDLLSPRFRESAKMFFDAYKRPDYDANLKTARHRLSAIHKDGREIFVEMGTNEIHLNNEITYVGIIHDITESRAARIALESSETRLRTITENVPAGIAYFDVDTRILFSNKIYASWLGHNIDTVQNKRLNDLMDANDYQQAKIYVEQVLNGQEVAYEHVSMHASQDQPRATHVTYIADRDSHHKVKGFFALITDITERKHREEMLTHLANHDTLTNLPNRRLFNDRLKQAMIRSHRHHVPLALFTLDVDHFKKINDSMGHDIGDELLKTLSRRLQGCVRDSDTVARMGGDEFTILLDRIESLESLENFSEKLLATIREPMTLGAVTLSPSSSIGVAVYCAENISADALLKTSDTALYKAKENGRNGYYIEQSIWPVKTRVLRLIPDNNKPAGQV